MLATRLHNILFSSLLGAGGGRARGRDPLEELRNADAFLHTRRRLPLAPGPTGLARSGDAFPATGNVPSPFSHPVMPSTKVLSLGIPPFI